MQATSPHSGRLGCNRSQLNAYTAHYLDHTRARKRRLHSGNAQASRAHLDATASSAAPQGSVDDISVVSRYNNNVQVENTRRRSRYLSYAEYVELKAQQQAANGSGEPAHEDSKQPDTTNESREAVKKRVPWNKGRKHSALTIARITQGATLAAQRPEVRAKYDAWNQSRIGVPLPEQHRENIRRRAGEARLRKLQDASPEELQAWRAAVSERSKALWQDPEYAGKTTAAMRAARRRLLVEREAAQGQEPDSSSTGGSSRAPKPKQQRARAAGAEGRDEEQQQQQQQQVQQPRQRQPTKKELVAAAAEQNQQLQQQVTRLLQTQQLIHTTERTVQQLQANLAAFENNPQSYAMASHTMQRAQTHLQQARAQVQQLEQVLGEYGVQWDSDTGQITQITNGLAARLQQQKAAAKGGRKARNSPTGSNSSGKVGSIEDGVVRSRRGKLLGAGTPRNSSSLVGSTLPGDVVPSPRRVAAAGSVIARSDSAANSSKGSAAAAAEAEAAAGGGSGGSNCGDGSWSMVGSQVNGGSSSGNLNGHQQQLVNGHKNGYKGGEGSRYVTVQLQAVEGDEV